MTIWKNPNLPDSLTNMHDDMGGSALSLASWPSGLVQMSDEEVASVRALTFDAAVSLQSEQIDAAYSSAITADIAFTTSGGVAATFQADADSQQVLSVSLQGYERAGSVPDGFFWKAANNDKVPFTLADLGALDKAMLDRGWAAFQKKTTLKAAIAAAATIDEVQAIIWS